jgi:hypothetical protein
LLKTEEFLLTPAVQFGQPYLVQIVDKVHQNRVVLSLEIFYGKLCNIVKALAETCRRGSVPVREMIVNSYVNKSVAIYDVVPLLITAWFRLQLYRKNKSDSSKGEESFICMIPLKELI